MKTVCKKEETPFFIIFWMETQPWPLFEESPLTYNYRIEIKSLSSTSGLSLPSLMKLKTLKKQR